MTTFYETTVPARHVIDATLYTHLQARLAVLYQAAVESQLPVALWRAPNQEHPQAVIDFSGYAQPTHIDFTNKAPGFAFSPFVNQAGSKTFFIKADLHINSTGYHFWAGNTSFRRLIERGNQQRFWATYENLLGRRERYPQKWVINRNSGRTHCLTELEYCRLVSAAIDYIQTSGVRKIVVSRATEVPLPPAFNPLTTFEALCQRYPQAFISLVSIPTIGTWLGASPETLLTLQKQSIRTVALAGTQAQPTGIPLDQVTWGAKEIEEQALVSEYIHTFFTQVGVKNLIETGPRTVSAGNVVHLQTDFEVRSDEPHLARLANQILHQLHPTSAVCGMPQQAALSFILENEGYDREFYSGFLGPIHLNEESHLLVNLRCMQLKDRSALLYVGGGITHDSEPQAEWQETVLKSKTLLNVLKAGPYEI